MQGKRHCYCRASLTARPVKRMSWLVALVAGLLLGAAPAAAQLPVPTDCQTDVACKKPDMSGECPDDEPGQKDLTQFCTEAGDPSPTCDAGFCSDTGEACSVPGDCPGYNLHSLWNWDVTTLPGSNTGDACSLYDSNTNGFADLAVCVTIRDGGQPASLGSVRLFSCGDTRVDRCPNSVQISGNECVGGHDDGTPCSKESDCTAPGVCIPVAPLNTSCEVSQQMTNPFDGGEDTEAVCWVDLDDFAAAGATAVLLDACSYPSEQPGSDPSDCVVTVECTQNDQCDDGNECTTNICTIGVCT